MSVQFWLQNIWNDITGHVVKNVKRISKKGQIDHF